MLFNSYIFIFLFFPACLLGYYGLIHFKYNAAARLFLIIMSFWFYGYFRINYLFIMIFSIAINYIFHRIMSQKPSKPLICCAVAANLGLLFYFKYFDFFITNINATFCTSFALKNIVLPLGISFFTFQQIGFIVDTYRGEVKNCSLSEYVLFVAFFPQLIAGPIVNGAEMLPQFARMGKEKFDAELFFRGLALFIMGLFKKVILADTLGAGVDYGYLNMQLLGRIDAVIVIIAYSLQLYFDFSGYCDMARGLGAMLGFHIPVNFNSPYKAVNIIDFWKRWHITLNRFFTGYVYIPLGGNRKGKTRMYVNLLLVFLLSGIWHGAGWNFIVWGMMHGVLYVITRWLQEHVKGGRLHMAAAVKRILLFIYVSMAWVYFRADSIASANSLLKTALTGRMQRLSLDLAECFKLDEFWYVIKVLHFDAKAWSGYILMFVMLAAGLMLSMAGINADEAAQRAKGRPVSCIMLAGMLVWCILSFSGVSTFLYFNF